VIFTQTHRHIRNARPVVHGEYIRSERIQPTRRVLVPRTSVKRPRALSNAPTGIYVCTSGCWGVGAGIPLRARRRHARNLVLASGEPPRGQLR
jgi:hypothetical protein